jgi:hypothetical protein
MLDLIAALELAAARPQPFRTRSVAVAVASVALVVGIGTVLALGPGRVVPLVPVLDPPAAAGAIAVRSATRTAEVIPARVAPAVIERGALRTLRVSGSVSTATPTATPAATVPAPAPEADDRSEVTRLGRIELGMVDGIRAERALRLDDIPNYRALVVGARTAIERGDAEGARAGMRAMRVAIDGVTIDAAFVAVKTARLVAKRADVRGPADQLAELDAELAAGKQAAAAGRFVDANRALDLAAKRFASELQVEFAVIGGPGSPNHDAFMVTLGD